MTEESRFNGEYRKTGSGIVTDADNERVRRADEKMKKYLDFSEDEEITEQ